jgi:hypothetical protein
MLCYDSCNRESGGRVGKFVVFMGGASVRYENVLITATTQHHIVIQTSLSCLGATCT